MKKSTLSVIAAIAILVILVGVFAACKNKTNGDIAVSVSTDENGSLYYTDPTTEIDGITYGGETHYVKPDETNKHGEYRINPDHTSTPYTTDSEGNVAPVTTEPSTTAPNNTTTTTTSTTTTTTTASSSTESQTAENTTAETTTEELHGLEGADDGNNLSDDGVINAW